MSITVPAYDQTSAVDVASITYTYASANDETLVCLISANSYGADGEDACRVSSVTDSAHNIWTEEVSEFVVGASGDPYVAARCSIWICKAGRAISRVTVSMTEVVDALAFSVVRTVAVKNSSPVIQVNSGQAPTTPTTTPASSGSVTAGGSGSNAIVLGVAAVADTDVTMTPSATTWTALTAVDTASITAKNNVRHRAAYRIITASAAQSINWNLSPSTSSLWCFIALAEGAIVTTNPNPRWPALVHEAGFGVDPNDPTAVESWTDVTSRVTAFTTRRGRDYELARTEAGEAEVRLNNWDGRFDPLNASGTYYPNIRIITPYRIRATWNGQLYRLFTGHVERWPQKWEEERGVSRLQVVDGMAALAGALLQGSLASEIIADIPHAYWPMDDGALAASAANKATTTTTPLAKQTSPNGGGQGFFGSDMSLNSEQSACWRQTRSQTTGTLDTYGVCLGAPMTLPQLSSGIVVDLWAKISSLAGSYAYTLFALKGSAAPNADKRVVLLTLDSTSGLPALLVSDAAGALTTYNGSASGYNDNEWHHYAVHVTTTTANLWIDGTLRATGAPVPTGATIDYFEVGGEVDPYITGSADAILAGDLAHVAIFQAATVDSRRVAVRANAGLTGFPERTGSRMSRLLSYAGWTGGRAIDGGLSFLGAAATIARQTLLAAVQDVANWENGLVFVDGSGNLRFIDRFVRFNQVVKYTFGENYAGGEIPYDTDVEIDYDPKYIYNDVTVTRSVLRLPDGTIITGGSSSHKKDDPSISAYFTRTYDKSSGVNSVSQCEAEATWLLENYAEPRARLTKITITPSTNPALWPTALAIEIGDLVTVKRRPFGGAAVITLNCYVEQVSHRVQQNEWNVVLSLSPELLTTYDGQDSWVLGTSVLGIDTIVGSP